LLLSLHSQIHLGFVLLSSNVQPPDAGAKQQHERNPGGKPSAEPRTGFFQLALEVLNMRLEFTHAQREILASIDVVAQRLAGREHRAVSLLELLLLRVLRRVLIVGKVGPTDEDVDGFP